MVTRMCAVHGGSVVRVRAVAGAFALVVVAGAFTSPPVASIPAAVDVTAVSVMSPPVGEGAVAGASAGAAASDESEPSTGAVGAGRVVRGVVDVYAQLTGAVSAGTGIVVSSGGSDDLVLTNAHVVAGAKAIEVIDLDLGRRYQAELVGPPDLRHDVAVLHLGGSDSQPVPALGADKPTAATLGDSDEVRVGDRVTAVGNAGGRGGAPSIAQGRVTELGATVRAEDEFRHTTRRLRGMIAVSAAIQPGDSGGPLFDDAGRVVGMDTAGPAGGKDTAPGRRDGYAMPIDTALQVAQQHGWLDGAPETSDDVGDEPDRQTDGQRNLTSRRGSLGRPDMPRGHGMPGHGIAASLHLPAL